MKIPNGYYFNWHCRTWVSNNQLIEAPVHGVAWQLADLTSFVGSWVEVTILKDGL